MVKAQPQRKLVAILHADVDGSTALVQRDEGVAHERITSVFNRLSGTIGNYGGAVHEIRGDALVAEFPRASDAVCAALAFQAANAKHNETLNDRIRPKVRIGVSLGEVIIADNTVTGTGVVLAQRVEQLADSNGVCITGAVHEALPGSISFDQQDLGEREVKGFGEPVRVYAIRLTDGANLPSHADTPRLRASSIARWLAVGTAIVVVIGVGVLTWF